MTTPQFTLETVNVHIKGTFPDDMEDMSKLPYSVGHTLRFSHDGHLVEAHLDSGIWVPQEVDKQYVAQIATAIDEELTTIDRLMPDYERLVKEQKAPDQLFIGYPTKDELNLLPLVPAGKYREIYDMHSSPPGTVMDTLCVIKCISKGLLKPEFHDLKDMARDVYYREGKTPHVRGHSLENAMTRAIRIYEAADRIRSAQNVIRAFD